MEKNERRINLNEILWMCHGSATFLCETEKWRVFYFCGAQTTVDWSTGLTVWPIASRVAAYLQLSGKRHWNAPVFCLRTFCFLFWTSRWRHGTVELSHFNGLDNDNKSNGDTNWAPVGTSFATTPTLPQCLVKVSIPPLAVECVSPEFLRAFTLLEFTLCLYSSRCQQCGSALVFAAN